MENTGKEENAMEEMPNESEYIEGLKEDTNYFAQKYNEIEEQKVKTETDKIVKEKQIKNSKDIILTKVPPTQTSRPGGVYIPPHKLRKLQEEMLKEAKTNPEQMQRMKWEMLRKSINEIINKVNVSNIQNVIIELLNENILRGSGLLARAIIKAQMASPNFTHVYGALTAVINTRLSDVAHLIIRRVILQFRRAYQRNNRIVCIATIKFLAHLINQKVLSDLFGLELLIFLLEEPTEDSVEIACEFMTEWGQVLSELTPAGVNYIFEQFKGILHEGEIERKVQYRIENLFAIRKNKFKDHQGVIPELDLVDDEDQITHNIELDSAVTGDDETNIFRFDPFYEKTEEEWKEIKLGILGEENLLKLKAAALRDPDNYEDDDDEDEPEILDFTEQDLLKLRETIYLTIMNSIDFEECAHKLLKLNIGQGHEDELSSMIIDWCTQERTYLKFYGLLASRFWNIDDIYKRHFFRLFVENYTTIHRLQTNKIRNLGLLFSHLLMTDSLDWHVLKWVTLTEEATTASWRIFLKVLFQDLAENMGLKEFCEKVHDPDMKEYFVGLFPKDHPKSTLFAINFFSWIGLHKVVEPLKEYLDEIPQFDEAEKLLAELNSGISSSTSSSSSSSSENSDDSESELKQKNKKSPVKPTTVRRRASEDRSKKHEDKSREKEKIRLREKELQKKYKRKDSSESSKKKSRHSRKEITKRNPEKNRDSKRKRSYSGDNKKAKEVVQIKQEPKAEEIKIQKPKKVTRDGEKHSDKEKLRHKRPRTPSSSTSRDKKLIKKDSSSLSSDKSQRKKWKRNNKEDNQNKRKRSRDSSEKKRKSRLEQKKKSKSPKKEISKKKRRSSSSKSSKKENPKTDKSQKPQSLTTIIKKPTEATNLKPHAKEDNKQAPLPQKKIKTEAENNQLSKAKTLKSKKISDSSKSSSDDDSSSSSSLDSN